MSRETRVERPVLLFVILLAGVFITVFNTSIIGVVLPKFMEEFAIPATSAQWLSTGYALICGICTPLSAYLLKRFTTRQLFFSAMLFFLAGTLLSAFAPSYSFVLAGRLIQALGQAITSPLIIFVVFNIVSEAKRGRTMGVIGLTMTVAPFLAPLFAGWIIEKLSWQWIYITMIPFIALILMFSILYLKNVSETSRSTLDTASLLLSTVGFGSLLYGVSSIGTAPDVEVILSIGIGLVALILLVWRQMQISEPLIDIQIFKYRNFTMVHIVNILFTVVVMADAILLPVYLQADLGYTVLMSAYLMMPGELMFGIMNPFTGRLYDKWGEKRIAIIGLLLIIVALTGFSNLTNHTAFLYLTILVIVLRIGTSFLNMPLATAELNQLPPDLTSTGSAVSITNRQVIGAIGASWFISLMSSRTAAHTEQLSVGGGAPEQVAKEASILAINDTFLFAAIITFVALFIAIVFIKKKTTLQIQSNPDESVMSSGVKN